MRGFQACAEMATRIRMMNQLGMRTHLDQKTILQLSQVELLDQKWTVKKECMLEGVSKLQQPTWSIIAWGSHWMVGMRPQVQHWLLNITTSSFLISSLEYSNLETSNSWPFPCTYVKKYSHLTPTHVQLNEFALSLSLSLSLLHLQLHVSVLHFGLLSPKCALHVFLHRL